MMITRDDCRPGKDAPVAPVERERPRLRVVRVRAIRIRGRGRARRIHDLLGHPSWPPAGPCRDVTWRIVHGYESPAPALAPVVPRIAGPSVEIRESYLAPRHVRPRDAFVLFGLLSLIVALAVLLSLHQGFAPVLGSHGWRAAG